MLRGFPGRGEMSGFSCLQPCFSLQVYRPLVGEEADVSGLSLQRRVEGEQGQRKQKHDVVLGGFRLMLLCFSVQMFPIVSEESRIFEVV